MSWGDGKWLVLGAIMLFGTIQPCVGIMINQILASFKGYRAHCDCDRTKTLRRSQRELPGASSLLPGAYKVTWLRLCQSFLIATIFITSTHQAHMA